MIQKIGEYLFGDMYICYFTADNFNNVEWIVLPSKLSNKINLPKRNKFDSLIQIKLVGDDYPKGFVTGKTMRNSQTTKELQYCRQEKVETEVEIIVKTYLKDSYGDSVIHYAIYDRRFDVIESFTEFINLSNCEKEIELLSSFSLSCLSPLNTKNKVGNLFLHRYRSKWGMEVRHERQPIEYYQLEPSWKPSGVGIEKYGQVGSMPVRGFFLYICIEDEENQVAWAAQIGHPGSWQIEAYRLDEDLCVSGGIADRDFGDWKILVRMNEKFRSPSAYLTVSVDGEVGATQRLTDYQNRALLSQEKVIEQHLPIQFNEFCSTWGKPSEQSIRQDIERLKGKGIQYYVIDAGWYADSKVGWEKNMGDWIINPNQFPNGLKDSVHLIKENGMTPGIWFEIETVGREATVFNLVNHLLQKDNVPITTGDRRFWDMRDRWVQQYLKEKVINFLKEYEFGYLKIDYNDNFGAGFSHPESLGEGNRVQLLATQKFIKDIKEALPDLVIENCSSGGHRLEPTMIGLTDVSSFSDAHEDVAIPIIAANLHSLLLPRQSLIWAVIRKNDSIKRIHYSMINTFLGRMCLSGDIHNLSKEQWEAIDKGIEFYKKIASILKNGKSYRYGNDTLSYREL
ncbi:glycoside hydrolase family 36 protein [Niallia sp. JL1B1071]|uniref:glycoside hydrolase family 36 protein n=1 Tax=Niallia tiangongensis TaxID=3237105 RepID=UPI0037DCCC5B